jgi:hypothetical protein
MVRNYELAPALPRQRFIPGQKIFGTIIYLVPSGLCP